MTVSMFTQERNPTRATRVVVSYNTSCFHAARFGVDALQSGNIVIVIFVLFSTHSVTTSPEPICRSDSMFNEPCRNHCYSGNIMAIKNVSGNRKQRSNVEQHARQCLPCGSGQRIWLQRICIFRLCGRILSRNSMTGPAEFL